MSARLDQLPSVAGWIAEARIDAAVAVDRLLAELDTAAAEFVIGGAAVVDDEHQRRHGAFCDNPVERLRRAFVDGRRLRLEQTQLETRLIGMLHRQPAIVAIALIRVDAESKRIDIEAERLVLIADVDTGDSDTRAHGTSFSLDPVPLPPNFRRRFSKTAILRFGRCAARTKQCGTFVSACCAAFSRARSSPGLSPVMSRKMRPKVPMLFQPVSNAISVTGMSVSRS